MKPRVKEKEYNEEIYSNSHLLNINIFVAYFDLRLGVAHTQNLILFLPFQTFFFFSTYLHLFFYQLERNGCLTPIRYLILLHAIYLIIIIAVEVNHNYCKNLCNFKSNSNSDYTQCQHQKLLKPICLLQTTENWKKQHLGVNHHFRVHYVQFFDTLSPFSNKTMFSGCNIQQCYIWSSKSLHTTWYTLPTPSTHHLGIQFTNIIWAFLAVISFLPKKWIRCRKKIIFYYNTITFGDSG